MRDDKKNNSTVKKFGLSMPIDVFENTEKIAKIERRSRANFITIAVEKYIEENYPEIANEK